MECGCKRSSLVACLANSLKGHALDAQMDDDIHPVLDALPTSNIHKVGFSHVLLQVLKV